MDLKLPIHELYTCMFKLHDESPLEAIKKVCMSVCLSDHKTGPGMNIRAMKDIMEPRENECHNTFIRSRFNVVFVCAKSWSPILLTQNQCQNVSGTSESE